MILGNGADKVALKLNCYILSANISDVVMLFYRYGAPKKLLSDQGREFVNRLNTDLAKKFDIDHMVTAAYHPQTNGLDER